MTAIAVILAIFFAGAHGKFDAKPCDVKTECQHPAFK
jgi:hypothetical protein